MSTAIPTEFQIYDSYEIDPTYQLRFTIAWASVTAAFVLVSIPILLRNARNGAIRDALVGFRENPSGRGYESIPSGYDSAKGVPVRRGSGLQKRAEGLFSLARALTLFTVPTIGIDMGQLILIIAYYILLLLCMTLNAELVDNPNRAGFLAIAQLPIIFLFASKNSPLSILVGGYGYEKINVLHRWSGRGAFLAATVHGALWIRNHLQYGLQILGAQKETSGVAAFALIGIIVLSSLRPVRVLCYQVFFVVHILAVVAFYVVVCYHTVYAAPYIYPPLAFYGFDLFFRMLRTRVNDATLIPIDKQFTIIRVENAGSGWNPGAHVRLRTFIGARMFESHPMTIMNAPADRSCLPPSSHALLLGARALGDWSKAINEYAHAYAERRSIRADDADVGEKGRQAVQVTNEVVLEEDCDPSSLDVAKLPSPSKLTKATVVPLPSISQWTPAAADASAPVTVMLDGPYGGCSLPLTSASHVLLLAGGSGITFALSLLDSVCGSVVAGLRRPANEAATRRIDLVWCIRGFNAIHWAAPVLAEIGERVHAYNVEEANKGENARPLDLRMNVYVTCLCSPESVPPIRGCTVSIEKPSIATSLQTLLAPSSPSPESSSSLRSSTNSSSELDLEHGASQDEKVSEKLREMRGVADPWTRVAVCAAGPEPMVRETRNAAARLALRETSRTVDCHTETYSF